MKKRRRHRQLLHHAILPIDSRLDSEKLHEEVHLSAPLARAGTGSVVARLTVSFLLEKLGRELVKMGFGIGFPKLRSGQTNLVKVEKRGVFLRKEYISVLLHLLLHRRE